MHAQRLGRFDMTDGVVDETRGRLFAIREDHTDPEQEATNSLVSINLDGVNERGDVLTNGNDFYASPSLNPDNEKIAWITWNHPNMPWDGTELWVGDLAADGSIGERQLVAGGDPGLGKGGAKVVVFREYHISIRGNRASRSNRILLQIAAAIHPALDDLQAIEVGANRIAKRNDHERR